MKALAVLAESIPSVHTAPTTADVLTLAALLTETMTVADAAGLAGVSEDYAAAVACDLGLRIHRGQLVKLDAAALLASLRAATPEARAIQTAGDKRKYPLAQSAAQPTTTPQRNPPRPRLSARRQTPFTGGGH